MKLNTLIVDDNEFDRYLLKRWLKACSFEMEITEASDGQNALEYLEIQETGPEDGYPPAIIFLDINMPRVNGFEFLEQFAKIRETQDLRSTVVVMFSSSPRQDDKDQAFAWDFVDDFTVKGDFGTEDVEKIFLEKVIARNIAADDGATSLRAII